MFIADLDQSFYPALQPIEVAGQSEKINSMDHETLLTLVTDIVSSHVSNNTVQPDKLGHLIQSVYTALSNVGAPVPIVEEALEPAVSIRSSVKNDAITCLECGRKMKMIKRHLTTDHGLTPAEYKARWNLNADYPLVAPEYAARRKELALKIGLGRKPGTGRKAGRPKKVVAAG